MKDRGGNPARATAAAILVVGGRVLLERRPDDARIHAGLWDTPGGHLEEGESPEQALLREMQEELGIVPRRYFLVAVQDEIPRGTSLRYRHYIYGVTAWEGEPRSRENRTIRWLAMDEALAIEPLNPLAGEALRKLRDRGRAES